ncbi:MAG: hypothetical protein FWH27_09720 [Planctomycetaceae bacterium]|nr:hypothetical protein [Planctomycetaceae bacterium]
MTFDQAKTGISGKQKPGNAIGSYTVQRHRLCIDVCELYAFHCVLCVEIIYNTKVTKLFTKVTKLIPVKWRSAVHHIGGANFGLRNGAVMFLPETLKSEVWERVLTGKERVK